MGDVVPFIRRRERFLPAGVKRVTGFAVVLEARTDAVLIVMHDLELGLTPAQARAIAEDLLELADDAEGRTF